MFCGPVVAQIGHLREFLYWLSVFSIGSESAIRRIDTAGPGVGYCLDVLLRIQ